MDFIFMLVLILILIILVILFVIFNKVEKIIGNFNLHAIFNAMKNINSLEATEYSRIKDVSGMTKLVEPLILKDFSDFNKNLLYQKVESNLLKIFNALEEKSIKSIENDADLIMIYHNIDEKIKDLNSCNLSIRYDAVKFHKHALKRYYKSEGMATVEISSTLEYYYKEMGNDNIKLSKKIKNVKKQTRYTTKFAYIYDESNFDANKVNFSINCPNCGAPINNIKERTCLYCSSYVEPINLKVWKMIEYKEDYKDI